ncbi:hypothetical protein SARC_07019 [Sphaeroforma arctica JP610]|uniref:Vesicle transport protein n=1 Tax=Sphaeroforma arctica JP610 TaxID=667725 RepID=A0A0L0FXG0_9EUKA|nr:hypothetical protein SARC_07019 [Sphaeroforma arctica JP610]KNC80628.1 hypothetical protein SARC_07019 [Sphaeroforma arctica JP610]|eukprot:XP_014154530.1 hypothetical protein SARC_07019 [Sphaeroforma arctica JP610]
MSIKAEQEVESSIWSSMSMSSKDESLIGGMSRQQRVAGFLMLLLGAMIFFALEVALFMVPGMFFLRPRKFALLHSLGSLCGIFSVSMLMGPMAHFKSLISPDRLAFTVSFFGMLAGTVYFALNKESILTVLCMGGQVGSLVWYLVGSIPGGTTGLWIMVKLSMRSANSVARTMLPL